MSSFSIQSSVPVSITNNSPANNDNVWVTVYGSLIVNPGNNQTPAQGANYYLVPPTAGQTQVVPTAVADLPPPGPNSPDGVILPSYTLTQWGNSLCLPAPTYSGDANGNNNQQYSGRILISVGAPTQAQVSVTSTPASVSSPSPASAQDPSTGTFYDFLEFTVASNADGSINVDIDTSQVDAFGLPMQLQFFKDAAATQAYNVSFTGDTTAGSTEVTALTATTGLGQGVPVTGSGMAPGSAVVSVPVGANPTSMTLNLPATATATGAALTAVMAGPVGVVGVRDDIFNGSDMSNFATFIKEQSNKDNASPFMECLSAAPMRIVSPKDICENPNVSASDALNNYFNAQVDNFFLQYFTSPATSSPGVPANGGGKIFSLQSSAFGQSLTYSGSVTLQTDGGYALSLADASGTDSNTYTIYYPFSTQNALADYTPVFPVAAPPAWISAAMAKESASQMIFACDAVFADNTLRGLSGAALAVQGDLENSISAAFNRGIILNEPSTWGDSSTWYPDSQPFNYWVKYWHQAGLTESGLAYAFPYDDKFGSSTNIQQSSVGNVSITLSTWGSTPMPTVTLTAPASGNQGGSLQLAASVSGVSSGAVPTGSISYFVDGCVMSNTSNQTSVALANGQAAAASFSVPALPDGAYTHSYTVTAVYSGDSNYQPAVATQTVQLTGPSGDFAVSLNPPQFPVGTTVSVTTVLPVAAVAGTLALNLIDSSQNVVASVAASSVSSATNVTPFDIPANVLSFAGIVTSGNNQITNVSSTNDLTPGQVLTGTGIPANTTIISFSPCTITMSGNANADATGASTTITSNAALVGFAIQAVYVPTEGSGTLTGQINFAFQA
ncbi:hypothetical protein UNDKW_3884 [Undibacterium sp. KW1]|uniref:beta-1,3-glucanase family protein n=1 Tax=Undibacterium sp. KW1 TaxID=2058624 RepID=UPI001331D3A4|nr:beta-1,3-glucanase family protein [Undibacterium sp. KW1]BBB62157.1 hypothetical protein UNDKW_3884 [Undibacterium sp. KW1]